MITDPNVYFEKGCDRCKKFDTPECKVNSWRDGLLELRRICLGAGLLETAKWGQPVYMVDGKNVCLIGAFVDVFFISFFDASLLADTQGVLEKRGANTPDKHMITFRDSESVRALESTIKTYIDEAAANQRAGRKPVETQPDVDLPAELIDAIDADPELAEAFAALTPGRQRGYCFHIGGAKQPATRISRIEKLRPRMLAGKGYNER